MKIKKEFLLYLIISILLLVSITFTWSSLKGDSSKQVRKSMRYIHELQEVGAILDETLPTASEYKEIENRVNNNSLVKYTLVTKVFGIDLNENYNIVGFLKNTEYHSNGKEITEKQAIEYAEKYLEKIITTDFKVKGISEDNNDETSDYTVVFYKYYKKYLSYGSEITMKINEYTGELSAYTGVVEDEKSFSSSININKNRVKEIAIKYLKEYNLFGEVNENPKLAYVKLDDNLNKLSYIVNVKITEGEEVSKEYYTIIDAENGKVLKYGLVMDETEHIKQ